MWRSAYDVFHPQSFEFCFVKIIHKAYANKTFSHFIQAEKEYRPTVVFHSSIKLKHLVAHDDNTHEEVRFTSKLRDFEIELSSLLHTHDRLLKNRYPKAQDVKRQQPTGHPAFVHTHIGVSLTVTYSVRRGSLPVITCTRTL